MKAKEVLEVLGVTHRTLTNYVVKGKLHPVKVNRTHYIYDEKEVFALLGKTPEKLTITYSRVSLPKQKNDLRTQTIRLSNYCAARGYKISEQIEDVKSGMSFKDRKGFCKLLQLVAEYKVERVVIENKDRLCRFGFELLQMIFLKFGTSIEVISDVENKAYDQELTDDLIAIIHYYSMKSYSNRRKLHKIEKELKDADVED